MHIAIVGLGAVGSMAAWRLTRTGHSVTAFEQFTVDHDQGSSFGDSRIIRRVYPDPLYTNLMADAFRLWEQLQDEWTRDRLFEYSGGLFLGPAQHPQVMAAKGALESARVPFEILDRSSAASQFPAVVLRDGEIGIYEPSMGYARASAAVSAAAALAKAAGARIVEGQPVVRVKTQPGAKAVDLWTADGQKQTADAVVVSAGSWTNELLGGLGFSLPLKVTRQPYVHFAVHRSPELYQPGRFPVWIDAGVNYYGFPVIAPTDGVKIGLHDHGREIAPSDVDRTVRDPDIDGPARYAAARFCGVGPEVTYAKVCLYTNTTTEDFVIDRVPGHERIVVASACSGHGFKFAPLTGEIAARLVTFTDPGYDLSRFRWR